MEPPSPSGPQGTRGAAAAAAARRLGSVCRAAPGPVAAVAEQRKLCRELGRGAPAPPRRHGLPPRASAGTSRGNPRASSRPSLNDPQVLRRPFPPPYFFSCSLCRYRYRFSSPLWQRSRHPPSGSRLPAPQKGGPHRRASPPLKAPRSQRVAGSAFSTAACPSRIRWPGTCMGRTKWVSGGGAVLGAPLPPPGAPDGLELPGAQGPGWMPLRVCAPRLRPLPLSRASRLVLQGLEK